MILERGRGAEEEEGSRGGRNRVNLKSLTATGQVAVAGTGRSGQNRPQSFAYLE